MTKGRNPRSRTQRPAAEVPADTMAAFHREVAALHRADPWRFLLDGVRVAIADRAWETFVLFMGEIDGPHALLLFDDLESMETYLDEYEQADDVADALETNVDHVVLELVRPSAVPAELLRRIEQHGWEVARPNAVPHLVFVNEQGVARPPTSGQVAIVTAVVGALVRMVHEPWWKVGERSSEKPFVASYSIETTTMGTLAVDVTFPILALDGLDALDDDFESDDADDGDEHDDAPNHAAEQFADSPEGRALGRDGTRWIVPFLGIAADRYGEMPEAIRPPTVEAVLFERFPASVNALPEDARTIVEDVRAFLRFSTRALGSPIAERSLAVLADDAIDRLARALGDKTKYGMAKAVSVAGREAGHDMTTQAGAEAFMKQLAGKPLPLSIWPGGPPIPPAATQVRRANDDAARRNRRKAERKARKKNR
jgi:hypothetical protein